MCHRALTVYVSTLALLKFSLWLTGLTHIFIRHWGARWLVAWYGHPTRLWSNPVPTSVWVMENRWYFNKNWQCRLIVHKNECPFLTCFPIACSRFSKAQTACKKNEARPGKIERQRAERGITEKALERDGRREVFVLFCSFWLFYSSTAWFLLVGRLITRALRLKWSRAAFAWAGPLFLF